jgi:hypothetical protein
MPVQLTWMQIRENIQIKSICNYILTTKTKDFKNIKIKTPNSFDSNHRMVIATIYLQTVANHRKYMKTKATYQLPIFLENSTPSELLFKEIYNKKPRTKKMKPPTNNWISIATYNYYNKKQQHDATTNQLKQNNWVQWSTKA